MNLIAVQELAAAAFILGMVAGMFIAEWRERWEGKPLEKIPCQECVKEWRCFWGCKSDLLRNSSLPRDFEEADFHEPT
jgi:hypothetical protein